MKYLLGVLLLVGCNPDGWNHYDLYFQVEGDKSYEPGIHVCGVATSARHAIWRPLPFGQSCQGPEIPGTAAFGVMVPAATLDKVAAEVPAFPVLQVDGEGMDLVASGEWNVAFWQAPPYVPDRDPMLDIPELVRVVSTEVAIDRIALHDGVVYATATESTALLRVPKEGDVSVLALPERPIDLDAWAGGVAVALGGFAPKLHVLDHEGGVLGEVALPVLPDGVRVGGDIAWVTGQQRIFAVDLSSPSSPELVDSEGVATRYDADTVLHADGEMFFLSSGRYSDGAVWDGTNPEKPKMVAGYHVGDGTYGVATAGQVLLLAAGSHGMQVWGPKRNWDVLDE